MSTTTPPLALGSIFLVEEKSFTIPLLALGFTFLVEEKVLIFGCTHEFKSTHEFKKYVQLENMYKKSLVSPTRSSCGSFKNILKSLVRWWASP